MFGVYLFSAVVGWLLVAFFLVSGGDTDFDAGSFDADIDLGGDADLDIDAAPGGVIDLLLSYISLRSVVFFLAFFGLTGIVLDALGTNALITAVAASGTGFFAATVNNTLIGYIQRTGASSDVRNRTIAGNAAEVVLPIAVGRKGRVAVEVGGQRIYLVATPYTTDAGEAFEVGETVVVIEVDRDGAKVARMEALE